MPVDNVLLKTKEGATRVGSVKGTFADIVVTAVQSVLTFSPLLLRLRTNPVSVSCAVVIPTIV